MTAQSHGRRGCAALVVAIALSSGALAQEQKKPAIDPTAAQNPIASLISIPFQNNTNLNYGPYQKTQANLIVQPVVPFHLTDEINLITRWITPLVYQPRVAPSRDQAFGLGNLQPQFYFTSAHPGPIMWGLGPQFWLPTASDDALGINKTGAGPAFAILAIRGPWVVGALVNQIWAGSHDEQVNRFTFNPFINYNLPGGWYLSSAPVITADWHATGSDRWVVPLGGGIGRVFAIGAQHFNARVQVFNNIVRPEFAPNWTLQAQLQLLFPAP